MGKGGLATEIWYSGPVVRRVAIVSLILLTGLVSYASLVLRPEGAIIATWWPAAGIGAVAVLASRGSRLAATVGVFAAAFAANLLVGRELGLTFGYGLANAVEVYVVAQLASRGGPEARLDSIRDVGRLMVAVIAGALSLALLGSATAAIVVGVDPTTVFFSLVASHGSALLVITPLALVSRRLRRGARPFEIVLQAMAFVGIMLFVFWPGSDLPLAFLPLTALLWAAFRMPTLVVAVELFVMALMGIRLTGRGGGPFADYLDSDPALAVLLLQTFLAISATSALFVSAARNDWGAAVVRLSARESLLRGGIVSSDTGILIAEVIDGDRLRVVGVNPTALAALGREAMPPTWAVSGIRISEKHPVLGLPELDALIAKGGSGRVEVETQGRRFDVDVAIHEGSIGTSVFTVVFTDVTQRDERERRALQAAEQLRDLNRQKDDFISSVSHELRTPVTSILGFAEDLEDAPLAPSERLAAEVIARNARRLADVIEDVLELSKLSSGVAIARPAAPLDLRLVLAQCVQDAEGLAPTRGIEIRLTVPEHPVVISAEAPALARVLANLLSNAVKFSDDGGVVEVSLEPHGDGWRVRIEDHGMGIPPDQLEHVWGRFSRVQDDRHRDVPGTGLGLPIVRELVEKRLGGAVRLESDGATGTTALLDLPTGGIEEPHAPQPPAALAPAEPVV
ncbi:ATP-binding protein [Microcella daejeonensis]|uniref:ATP-binding protein n=1 Tax=Microcella daejeonensis TaxID=2994971 RepID=UPI00226DE059|nr:ATP-binding protein [Microcella daejeonensis]WAB84446.1 ATP-binding protein [Microcella daejeonensis]